MHIPSQTMHSGPSGSNAARFLDPLGPDDLDDAPVLTTRRALSRVALVASETATRFALDGIPHEPMAWMMAPRRMFAGGAALEACLRLEACTSAIALHRVGETLDAEPSHFDDAGDDLSDPDPEPDTDHEAEPEVDRGGAGRDASVPPRTWRGGPIGCRPALRVCGGRADRATPGRLFSAVVHDRGAGGFVQAFAAMVTHSRVSFCSALIRRYGGAAAESATVVEGFDPSDPLVTALVSPAIADVLVQVASDPGSPLGEGLDVRIEQRFIA